MDNIQKEAQPKTSTSTEKQFYFRKKIAKFLLSDGQIFRDYYEVQK